MSRKTSTHREAEIFNCKKHSRYFQTAWAMLFLAVIGLIYFIQIWPARLPAFLQNTNFSWLMSAAGIILGAFVLFSTLVFYREAKESIILTEQNLILASAKETVIPIDSISRFSLGSSPLEKLSQSNSLWIILKGEPEKSILAGPLTPDQAVTLKNLLEEKTNKN